MDLTQLILSLIPKEKQQQATQMAANLIQKINPQGINNQQQAIQAINQLKSYGLPPSIVEQVNKYINTPVANMAFNSLGINKDEFKNGLQSVLKNQPETRSALTSNIPLLQGIDQLGNN